MTLICGKRYEQAGTQDGLDVSCPVGGFTYQNASSGRDDAGSPRRRQSRTHSSAGNAGRRRLQGRRRVLAGSDVPGQCGGVPQSKVLSCQVFSSSRKYSDRYLRLFVDQSRNRSIASHGNQTAAARARLASVRSVFRSSGVQATSVAKPSFASFLIRRRTSRLLPPVPELRLATIPTRDHHSPSSVQLNVH